MEITIDEKETLELINYYKSVSIILTELQEILVENQEIFGPLLYKVNDLMVHNNKINFLIEQLGALYVYHGEE